MQTFARSWRGAPGRAVMVYICRFA